MAKNHYHAMNGSIGCLPDNNEVFTNRDEAISYLVSLFYNVSHDGMYTSLKGYGLHYFDNSHDAGAEYCEVSRPCTDPECLEGDN